MKTICGHDVSVRCVKCAGQDFDPVQPRRWAKLSKQSPRLTELQCSPDEARAAVMAILAQIGFRLDKIQDYDYGLDEFRLLGRDAEGRVEDVWIPGEAVAGVVKAGRTFAGAPAGLLRPSERRAMH